MEFDKLLAPFWEGKEVFNETVMLLSEGGKEPYARLFYEPDSILSVSSTDGKTEYIRGVDWEYKNGRLIMLKGSSMPYMNSEELHFYGEPKEGCLKAKDGGHILYEAHGYFHKRQLAVSYTHSDAVDFGIQHPDENKLKKSKALIKNGQDIRICFYGDSITAGCDSSSLFGIEPFLPTWPELFCKKLENDHGCKVELINTAVGGKQSDWGLECADERIASYKPDLAVIAFGMNDGTERVSTDSFYNNIMGIKDKVLGQNAGTEFIFIATTLPNPESVFDGYQRDYYSELLKCAGECDEVLNMTKVHDILLSRKRFVDMTGNNINHPNDFLIRIYAQALSALF